MPAKKYTREGIIETLRNVAANLGRNTLSKRDVQPHLALSTVNRYFGSLGNALEATGLRRTAPGSNLKGHGSTYTDEDLFASIFVVEQQTGQEPGYNAYQAHGQYSMRPFVDRFGKWPDVLAQYRLWKADQPHAAGKLASEHPLEDAPEPQPSRLAAQAVRPATTMSRRGRQYGEFIHFRGLTHAPMNELGVVFLFGMVSRELEFEIEALGAAFPDCEGKHLCDPKNKQWESVQIEFEFKASNFLEHGHNVEQCDVIVCWENDWPDCPVEVVELRSEIQRLSPN